MSKILIVEDDKNILKALVIRLHARGHSVATAQDGETARQAAEEDVPDLVLMDISLPSSNGFEVVQAMRDSPTLHGVAVVFLTASRRPGLRDRAAALGASGFFEKPFDGTELMECIESALEQTTT